MNFGISNCKISFSTKNKGEKNKQKLMRQFLPIRQIEAAKRYFSLIQLQFTRNKNATITIDNHSLTFVTRTGTRRATSRDRDMRNSRRKEKRKRKRKLTRNFSSIDVNSSLSRDRATCIAFLGLLSPVVSTFTTTLCSSGCGSL